MTNAQPLNLAARTEALQRAYSVDRYEITQETLAAAHQAAQPSRFAASPSFAATLEQAIAQRQAAKS